MRYLVLVLAACHAPTTVATTGPPPPAQEDLAIAIHKCTFQSVARSRAEFVASRPPSARDAAASEFDAWLARNVANTFGPMPDVSGVECPAHEVALQVGLEETQREEHDRGLGRSDQGLPFIRRGQFLGGLWSSPYSWTVYCPECERQFVARRAGVDS